MFSIIAGIVYVGFKKENKAFCEKDTNLHGLNKKYSNIEDAIQACRSHCSICTGVVVHQSNGGNKNVELCSSANFSQANDGSYVYMKIKGNSYVNLDFVIISIPLRETISLPFFSYKLIGTNLSYAFDPIQSNRNKFIYIFSGI